MNKLNKQKLIPWAEVKNRLLKNKIVRKSYDDLEFEFQIIESLIKIRTKKQITQQQLADRIGITQSALARFESGRINPRLDFLTKIINGLGLKIILK